MNIKFFIRTTGERTLHESIKRELGDDYTLLIDKEHKPVDSFIKQLKQISEYDAILLEDDVILCKDFKKEIEKVIKEYPNTVINFFTKPLEYFSTVFGLLQFVYNQCTFYPKGLTNKIADKMIELREPYNQYDTLENKAMRALNIPHLRPRPALVQHIDNNTFIQQSTSGARRCIWFKDYLDELNIDYKDAYTLENKEKLTQLMNKKFKGEK